MKKKKITSRRFSFSGWNIKEFLKGYLRIFRKNWSTAKEIGKIVLPGILVWIATYNPIWTVVFMALGKAGLDIIEYWVKEHK